MNTVLLQIKILYDDMGKSEKRIADWILQNPDDILPLSITELAEKSTSSEATIVRFARRLGFSGYQELKISIAQESDKKIVSNDITAEDSCFEVFQKVCNDIYCSLEMTKKVVDEESINIAAEKIMNAYSVSVFGLGNSASVAVDAVHKLLRVGIVASACSDNHIQAIIASHMSSSDVVIGISHSGSSKDIVDSLKIAKEKGATTICITNKGKSPILKYSDIVLYTSSPETEYTILGLNSRIAALSIIDAIYTYIVVNKKESIKSIKDAEYALNSKKY